MKRLQTIGGHGGAGEETGNSEAGESLLKHVRFLLRETCELGRPVLSGAGMRSIVPSGVKVFECSCAWRIGLLP